MKKSFPIILIFLSHLVGRDGGYLLAQNIGISTDGSVPETGVMLDVKGANAKATTKTQNAFQVKSNDASFQLKLRLILGTNATATSMFGGIEVVDSTGVGAYAYRTLSLQPYGGNVGIGITLPMAKLDVVGNIKLSSAGTVAGQGTFLNWNDNTISTLNGLALDQGASHIINQRGTGLGGFSFDLFSNANSFILTPLYIGGTGSVGIGTTLPNSAAFLEVGDGTDTKGLLIPRVSLTSAAAYAPMTGTAVTSLLVYNTNASMTNGGIGFWYWDGTQWVRVLTGGNSTTVNSHCYTCDGF